MDIKYKKYKNKIILVTGDTGIGKTSLVKIILKK